MRDMKRIALYAVIGCILAAVLALAGCKVPSFQATNCSNGQCVTTSVGPAGNHHASSPATRASETPTQPTTATTSTAQPSIPGATAPAPDPTSAVTTCLGSVPAQDTLVQLTSYNSAGAKNLATCLAIPPQQMDLFLHLAFKAALQALKDGDFNSDQGRQDFTSQTLPPIAQRCHAGEGS